MISTNKSVKQLFRQKLAVAITGTTLALTSFGIFPDSAKAGFYSLSCKQIFLSDGILLRGKCHDGRSGYRYTSIDLNTVIGNKNGNLSWGITNFSNSCRKIKLVRKNVLSAECANINGIFFDSNIYLDQRLQNRNGKLQLVR